MTPQERQLLAAVTLRADYVTLAFCLDREPKEPAAWHSIWSPVTETFLRCRDELAALPGAQIKIETLERTATHSRFSTEPLLQHLESHWANRIDSKSLALSPDVSNNLTAIPPLLRERARVRASVKSNLKPESAIRIVACPSPEAEVEFAAHEIRSYVRQGGRFRDTAVLLRSLEGYHHAIRRVFLRYEIPFFLDQREPVTHHPLAEVTRYALRLAAFGWEHDDWFGALKTGLVHDNDAEIDYLENEALAHGWRGKSFWLEPILVSDPSQSQERLELLRQKIVPAFQKFIAAAGHSQPTGAQLASAVRGLWRDLKVARRLQQWTDAENLKRKTSASRNPPAAIHETVWDQMCEWLRNLEIAFADEALPLGDWLPIMEAGLSHLTVGVIPPALDQVLVGAIDRSRNPDLQVAFVLGVNEGVFPAPPPAPILLNRSDRETLAAHDAPLGPDTLRQIGLEHYYGYIACTRARRQLVLTYAERDTEGRPANPSPFVDHVHQLFPGLETEQFSGIYDAQSAEHWTELAVLLLRSIAPEKQPAKSTISALDPVLEKWGQMAIARTEQSVPPHLIEKIYGKELRTSVSGLEDFAACPFQFFAGRGLRAEERLNFEMDAREKGSFQHEVLKAFHLRLQHDKKRWRDVSPAEAQALVREVGEQLLPEFRNGLLLASPSRRFAARLMIEGLERLIETLVNWMQQYRFDPALVETGFGLEANGLPAWRIELGNGHALLLRGRIDRVDICNTGNNGEALVVVIDYKTSPRVLDPVLLHHGLELQLLAYLGALSQFGQFDEIPDVSRLIPVGAFYVALKSSGSSADTRDDEREDREGARMTSCQHRGRFDGGHLEKFDNRGEDKGNQFVYRVKKDGAFAGGAEALPSEEFRNLVSGIEGFLRQHGRDIYTGNTAISPYRLKQETACDFCKYRSVCRFDPWTQPYRVLHPPPKEAA